jgi:beta-glucosidase
LSYSRFVYKDMAVEAVNDESNVVAKACITVENISDIAGKETVQLYIRDLVAQVVRPLKELRGFRKILLEAGQQQTVEFMITREMLSYWNAENNFIFEPGEFEIMLGRNSAETDSVTLSLA